jgi:hypothetical protein
MTEPLRVPVEDAVTVTALIMTVSGLALPAGVVVSMPC